MKRFILLLLIASVVFAAESLEITGDAGSYTVPNSSPFNAIGDHRGEVRFHNFSGCTADWTAIWSFGGSTNTLLRCRSSGAITITDWRVSQAVTVNPSGMTDFLIRFQSDISEGTLTAELWEIDGTGYALSSNSNGATSAANLSGNGTVGSANLTAISIAWVRWYSTIVDTGSAPPSVDDAAESPDLGHWRFEGALTDSSGNGMTVSISGTAYVTTPTYDPVAVPSVSGAATWTSRPTVRAGFPATLTAADSVSFPEDDPTLDYFWTQVSGPTTLRWSDRTAEAPTVEGAQWGQYEVRLTVTDSTGATGTSTLTFGAVPTDDNGVIVHADPLIQTVFGTLTRHGTSPWPYLDERMERFADHFYPGNPEFTKWNDDWDTALAGTIAVTNGSATITGTGTDFQNDFCSGGSSPDNDARFVIWYDTSASSYGRRYYGITSCDSATQLTMSSTYRTTANDSGLNYSKVECFSCWAGQSDNANYYDNVFAQYSMYYRTGFTVFRDRAREMAELWWRGPVSDEGRMRYFGADTPPQDGAKLSANRIWALYGVLWWHYETSKDWTWMEAAIDNWADSADGSTSVGDLRELSYQDAYIGMAALLNTGNPSKQAEWELIVDARITDAWLYRLVTDHYEVGVGGYHEGWCGTGVDVTNSSTAIVGIGTGSCWAPSAFASYFLLMDGDTIAYDIASCSSATSCTLAAPYGGTTKSNAGYQIFNLVGVGNQPFIQGLAIANVGHAYSASGNEDYETILTALVDWTYDTRDVADRGLYYATTYPNCYAETTRPTESAGVKCDSNRSSARFFSCEVFNIFSRRYLMDSDADTLAAGDDLISATFGNLGGPGADAYTAADLNDTNTITANKAKNFGYCFGAGGAQTWLGARLGGQEARPTITVKRGFKLASVTGATKIVAVITAPNGDEMTEDCAGAQCDFSAEIDYRLGEHSIVYQYRDASENILARSDAQTLRAR